MTAITAFLERPDGRIAYDDTGGSGPLVVCVPGMGDVRGLYRLLAPALVENGRRVVTVDVRGHGESSVGWPDVSAAAIGSDIVALVRHLNAGPAIVIGESMAAGSAVWAAAESPDDVAGIILCGPAVRDLPASAFARVAVWLVGRSALAWTMFYRSLYPSRKPPDFGAYVARLTANLREPGRMAALRGMLAASKADCEARIGQVRCPALVVMGTADPDFADPSAEARLLAGRLDGDLFLVRDAGHYPQTERPDLTTPAVIGFLARARA